MTPADFINKKNTTASGISITDVISEHKRAGTLNKSVKFYPATAGTSVATENDITEPANESFFRRTAESFRGLKNNDFSLKDVVKEIPAEAKKQTLAISNFVAPALTKFFKTTGSIFGEGLAYAVDKNVREQYKAGNLDILPTVTEMTVPKLAKYTFAAGLETAILRSLPIGAQTSLLKRGGIGAIEGVGFAISEGLAKDESPEEIIKKMPLYGVSGAGLSVIAPYLLPLLKTEVKFLPEDIKKMFKKVDESVQAERSRKLSVSSELPTGTAVPISTPNSRYQQYLRSQGYEPYVPESKLPTIDAGGTTKKTGIPTVEPGKTPPKVSDGTFTPEPAFTEMVPEPTSPKITKSKTQSIATKPVVSEQKINTPEKLTPTITPKSATESVSVPSRQLPVGEGKTMTSRLEERMVKATETPEANQLSGEKRATYQQVSKKDQIQKASKYVDENPEEALAVLRGEKAPPEGMLDNAIALALAKKAELTSDAALATRLASLRSTRAGQEISLLTEADPDSVVSVIETIVKARKDRAVRKGKGTTPTPAKEVAQVKKEVSKTRLKIDEAEKLLNDILC